MHCTKCGAVLAPGAKFCTTCGAAVETYAPAEAYVPEYAPVESAPEYVPVEAQAPVVAPEAEQKSGISLSIWLLIALLILIAVVIIVKLARTKK